jgi:hypothetical protein
MGRAIQRQPRSGRLFDALNQPAEAGCRLNSPPHISVYINPEIGFGEHGTRIHNISIRIIPFPDDFFVEH